MSRLLDQAGTSDVDWAITILNDPEVGAYVLPGGKVFVNTGLLDFCLRNDELALILAHEIGHNVCGHASERLTSWLVSDAATVIGKLASGYDRDLVRLAIDAAFCLPHQRSHEAEADRLGLILMAKSGYDASVAVDVWSRWEDLGANTCPQYLRTHPSQHDRMQRFYMQLCEARAARILRRSSSLSACLYVKRTVR